MSNAPEPGRAASPAAAPATTQEASLLDQVMAGTMTASPDTQAMINARIGQIDALISEQLNAILHHEEFQQLESAWRGLHYFVHQSETGPQLKLKVMNVAKKDLQKDMER